MEKFPKVLGRSFHYVQIYIKSKASSVRYAINTDRRAEATQSSIAKIFNINTRTCIRFQNNRAEIKYCYLKFISILIKQ